MFNAPTPWLGFFQNTDSRTEVGKVVLDQIQVRMVKYAHLVQAPEIDGACSPVCTVDRIAFVEQQLSKICSILSGNPGN
jgi:hypothetical protein